jgi:hypothetical protein
MARKTLIYSYQFFNNSVLSATTSSAQTDVSMLDKASIDLRWSASTLVATVTVEAQNGDNAEGFRALDFGSPILISGASGQHDIILTELPFTYLRLTITRTSGSGTIDAVITSKAVGA